MFISSIKTVLTATLLASVFTANTAFADGGGGGAGGGAGFAGGDPSSITIYKKDGSSATARGRKGRPTYTLTKRDKGGKVVSRKRVQKKRPDFARIHNPDGSTREVRRARNGDRIVTDRNSKGRITKRTRIPRRGASYISATNPNTGITRVSGRTAKGARFSFAIGPLGLSFGHH